MTSIHQVLIYTAPSPITLSIRFLTRAQILLAWCNKLALVLGIMLPSTSQSWATVLRRELLHPCLELWSEMSDETLNWPCESLAQSANGVSLNLLGQLLEHVDLTLTGLSLLETLHDLLGPLGALATWCALSARLVAVEVGKAGDGADDVGGLVHDNDGGGTETRLGVLEGIKIHQLFVANLLWQDWRRRTTWNDSLQVVPSATDTTTVLVDKLTEWDRHLLFNGTWVVDVPGDTEELGTGVALAAEASEPVTTSSADGWCDSNGLDVGDGRWASEKTDGCWERWLKTWLSWLALEGLDQGSLLSADVSTHSTVDVNIEVVAGATGILADETVLVRLLDSALQNSRLVVELATNVDVCSCAVHGTSSDQTSLNQLVWVLAHNFSVFAGSWLSLISVNNQVSWLVVLLPALEVHERPLEARWETGATTTSQSGRLDLRNNLCPMLALVYRISVV